MWTLVAIMTLGVVAGTLAGERTLLGLSHERFRTIVFAAVGSLGIWFRVPRDAHTMNAANDSER